MLSNESPMQALLNCSPISAFSLRLACADVTVLFLPVVLKIRYRVIVMLCTLPGTGTLVSTGRAES